MPHDPRRGSQRANERLKALEHAIFGVVPVLWTVYLVFLWVSRDAVAFDFHHYYWAGGDRLLHGLSPYVHGPWYPPEVPVGLVYPAPAAVLFAGVAVVPREIGDVVFTALALAAPLLTLRLLDVRDWRVYGLVMLWPAVSFGAQTANVSMLFTVAVAAIWRYRDRARTAGLIFGVIVAMKLFLFPLALFFLATRRFAALAYSVVAAACLTWVAWLIVGLDELARYRATVEKFTMLREDRGYSIVGFLDRLGAGRPMAYAITVGLAAAAALACLVLGWRGRERDAFTLALIAGLLATPIMWLHYFVFLLVPIGMGCRRLHPLWAAPLLLYPVAEVHPSTPQVAIALAIVTSVLVATLRVGDTASGVPASIRPRRRRRPSAAPAG